MKPVGFEFRGQLTWNVVFEQGRTPWGHVLAFASDGTRWVVIDPHLRFTEVFTLSDDEFNDWILGVTEDATVLRVSGRRETSLFLPSLFCVGVVKRLVGIRSGALSPAGLKRDLLRAGAQQVFVRESQNAQGRPDHQVGS